MSLLDSLLFAVLEVVRVPFAQFADSFFIANII